MDDYLNFSPNVNFRSTATMRLLSRISKNNGDEPADPRGGVASCAKQGLQAPITSSKIVRINGSWAIRDGDRFEMDKASVDGPGNTIGEGTLKRDTTPRAAPKDERSWWQKTKDGAAAAAKAVGDFDAAHGNVLTRGVGVAQAVGGGVEAVVGGVGGVLTAETGIGAAAGYALVWNGVDNAVAGVRTAGTGAFAKTLTQQAAGGFVRAAGGGEGMATAAELVAGLGPGGVKSAVGAVGAVASKVGNLGKVAEDVPVAVKAAEEVPAVAKEAEETGKTVTKTAQAAEEASQAVRVTRNGYGYLLDKLGRTIRAAGKLKLNKAARDVDARRAAGGADRLATDQGGHLIGSRFDGTSEALNTVAQNQNLNQGAWKAMENSWAKALGEGKEVMVDVRPQYIGDSLRPSSFYVNYSINGVATRRSFLNEAGQKF